MRTTRLLPFLPLLILLQAFPFAQASQSQRWDLNDVSYLLPLPSSSEFSSELTLNPQTTAKAGELLPQRYLELLPPLARGLDAVSSDQLRVVSIRIDPCFPGVDPSGQPCRAQIRMVWQPLTLALGEIRTTDAAVHSFYELTDAEFRELAGKLASLNATSGASSATSGLPLQIHPVISKEGLAGSYWQQLRALFLGYAGEKRLSRVTFMTLEARDQMWDFGGLEIESGKVTRTLIPRIQGRQQSFINGNGTDDAFKGGAKPEAPGEVDTFNRILRRSTDLTLENRPLLEASATAIHRIENPRIHSPATMDCVSCHMAQAARVWATTRFPELNLGESPFKFQSPFNLDNASGTKPSTRVLRAFGYQGRLPAISQRTIHESAAVAEALGADRR